MPVFEHATLAPKRDAENVLTVDSKSTASISHLRLRPSKFGVVNNDGVEIQKNLLCRKCEARVTRLKGFMTR